MLGSTPAEAFGASLCREGRWNEGMMQLSQAAAMQKDTGKLPAEYYSWVGYGLAVTKKNYDEAVKMCRYAIKQEFYNPEHFRSFGIGVANGALWTITVELQYYVFVPVIYLLFKSRWFAARLQPLFTGALFFSSFAAYCVMDHKVNGPGGFTGAPSAFKLLHVTLIPHLWMFMLGIFIHRRFESLRPWLEGRFLYHLAGYVLIMAALQSFVEFRSPLFYLAYLPSRIILALGTIAAAYSARSLSSRLLSGMDLSYGTYLYHSVVINVFVQLGWMTSVTAVLYVFLVSIGSALLSWRWIEKPALGRKSFSPGLLWTRLTSQA